MNQVFSVDEEIDFSDDDIDFLGGRDKKEKDSNGERPTERVSVSLDHSYKPFIRNETPCSSRPTYSHCKNSGISNLKPKDLKSLNFQSSRQSDKKNNDCLFSSLLNDDTDELLSQIDLPVDDNGSIPNVCKKVPKRSDERNHKPNKIAIVSERFEYTNGDNERNEHFTSPKNFMEVERTTSGYILDKVNSNSIPSLPRPFSFKERNTEKEMNLTKERNVVTSHQNARSFLSPVTPISNVSPVTLVTPSLLPAVVSRSHKKEIDNSHRKTLQKSSSKLRRFPGPAGILPTIDTASCLDKLNSPEVCKQKRTLTPLKPETPIQSMISSSQDDDFNRVVWIDVKKQVSMLFPRLRCEMISDILRKATQNQLSNGKVGLFCGLIKSFITSGSGGKLVIKDPSGEINGTLHKNVLDEYESDLCHGSGVILKDVSIFSPSLKKHYINIIPSNIVQIFPAENDICTQTQPTSQSNTDKENVFDRTGAKKMILSDRTAIMKDPGNHLIEGSSDFFENENELESFFSEEFFD